MGLLDSVLSAVTQNAQSSNGGGWGDLIGQLGNNPQLIQVATSLLGNDGDVGGLEGLIAKFQQAGLGDVVASWVGSGHNQAISGDQLGKVLGNETLSSLARQLGVNPGDLAGQLSSVLPGLVDQLTPNGHAPAGGLGNAGDLMGSLGSLLGR